MKKILKNLIDRLPLLNWIVFESKPDFSDNTKYVFMEMINRKLYKKYKFIWLVSDPESAALPKFPNTIYVKEGSRRARFYLNLSKALISCNEVHTSFRQKQYLLFLGHGTAIKSVKAYYNLPDRVDNFLVASEGTVELLANELNAPIEKAVVLGYPRNDEFSRPERDLKPLFPDKDFEKIIIWYPTFRQHKNGQLKSRGSSLPIIHDREIAEKVNEFAKERKILIVLKPHFAQDVSEIKDLGLSNIVFINDKFYVDNNITSYEFVAASDALITDYSSIYYDFLLKDKPIAVVWEDLEEYKENPGIAVDLDVYLAGAEKVYNLPDMLTFLNNLATANDILKAERAKVCDLVNISRDGKNSERVTDYIIKKISK
ncbi:MAG: CDP-glycerol glycerophosphotransferase family protein [Clostridia bacterium]|nr:CDP-glycerol glycerophosphotransferase family protein [Clostridia bacterium]